MDGDRVLFSLTPPDSGIDLIMRTDMYRNNLFILDKNFNNKAVA